MLMAGMMLTSCRKEKAPEPSNLDKNYFVIEDNPNDPVDHARYEFYKNTGIASYTTDTIYKKKISKENESPARYTYITLSLIYNGLSEGYAYTAPLSSREHIPALLNLLQTELVPKLPTHQIIPSILFLDSFNNFIITDVQIFQGWSSLCGFNTIGIRARDVEVMSTAEKKMYAASILAGIAEKKIIELMNTRVQKEFLAPAREVAKNLVPADVDIYSGWPFMFIIPMGSEPPPQDFGFLFYPKFDLGGMLIPNMLRETDDIRGFLTAVFYYTEEEFNNLHTNETLVLKKFALMRSFAKEAGFKIPQ